jgi:transcriptional regulator with XRE-family HTH domain
MEIMDYEYRKPDPIKLRAAREGAGLSLRDMARILNVTYTQISHIERGKSLIKSDALATWAQVCKKETVDELYSIVEPLLSNDTNQVIVPV